MVCPWHAQPGISFNWAAICLAFMGVMLWCFLPELRLLPPPDVLLTVAPMRAAAWRFCLSV
jgi:hypothetical protein